LATLLFLQFPRSRAQYKVLPEKEILVGRAASCDIDLTRYFRDQLQAVSRQHFKLFYRKGEGFFIVDLSYNGTWVNNECLTKNQPRVLRNNDVITLAKSEQLLIKAVIDDDPDVTDAISDPETFFYLNGQNGNGLSFDETTSQFVIEGQAVPHEQLTKLEVSLLTYLYRNIGRLCSFDDIALQVWDDPQWAPENNTISRAVTNLRKKLNDFSPGAGEYIQNIRGQGYKLVRKKE
jgi:hypothetical protein